MTRAACWWAAWPIALVFACLAALWLGVTGGGLTDAVMAIFGSRDGHAGVVATHRLPRTVAAVIIGVHLGLAGAILQIVLRNPLADPTILGISGGASLAVVLTMSVAISTSSERAVLSVAGDYLPLAFVPPIALAGGMSVTVLVLAISWDRRIGSISSQRLLLTGVVMGAILNAAVMALVLALSEARTEIAIQWLSGSLYARGLQHLIPTLPFTVIGILALLMCIGGLSTLRFENKTAQSVGTDTRRAVPLLVLIATGLAASAVAVAGPIGFVGLLAPHIARRLKATSLGAHLWASAFIGALLVVTSDMVGRLVAVPLEMPVGIVTSLIGAPIFAILLSRSLRSGHVIKR